MQNELLDQIESTYALALEQGKLLFQETVLLESEPPALKCHIRQLSGPNVVQLARSSRNTNPFLCPEPELTVCTVSKDYLLVLNKYPVAKYHCLLIRSSFVDHCTPIQALDFENVWNFFINSRIPHSFLFYNFGAKAGASQPHRHFHFVFFESRHQVPFLEIVDNPWVSESRCALPFLHHIQRIDQRTTGANLYSGYIAALESLQGSIGNYSIENPFDHNLVISYDWMMVVPRKHETFETLSPNSFAMLGLFLSRNPEETRLLRTRLHDLYKCICY